MADTTIPEEVEIDEILRGLFVEERLQKILDIVPFSCFQKKLGNIYK